MVHELLMCIFYTRVWIVITLLVVTTVLYYCSQDNQFVHAT